MIKHTGTVPLASEGLILRRFQGSDAPAVFHHWASDEEVVKYLNWERHQSLGDSMRYVERCIKSYDDKRYYHWAVVPTENPQLPIGAIFATEVDDTVAKVHIAYNIGKQWWNRGYTSRAMAMVIRHFFECVHYNRVEARHDPRNPYSGRVMIRCGMKFEGTLRQWEMNNQGVCDASYYAILRDDYR